MKTKSIILSILALGAVSSNAALVWTVGDGTDADNRDSPELANIYASTGTTTFVAESGTNALPGVSNSPATDREADDDFYFPGQYDNQVDGGTAYSPLGLVASPELGVERAFAGTDTDLRYHFNFSASHAASDVFTISLALYDMDDDGAGTGAYTGTFNINGVSVGGFVHNASTLNTTFTSNGFTLGDINATAGAFDDNYVQVSVVPSGGARWANMNYISMDVTPVPEPSSIGFLAIAAAGIALVRRRRS